MNGFENTSAHCVKHLARGTLFAAVLAVGAASPVRASALQTEWNRFLAGGETVWASRHAPPITLQIKREIAVALRSALTSSNPLSIPFVPYLEWRRDLNPTRFDRWHPIEGPIIAKLPTSPSINPAPQLINNTPEPGTLTLAAALVGAGLWWRRRRPACGSAA